MNDFCIFILTHGRPDNIKTIDALQKSNYTGKFYIIIDDEDATSEKYFQKYGDKVIMFSKSEIEKKFDTGDNFENRGSAIHARNVCFELAKKVGVKYFMQLDDDYSAFEFRIYKNFKSVPKNIKCLDDVINAVLKFYKKINAETIAFAQGGDFIGGAQNNFAKNPNLRRKAMNSFICSVDRPFKFQGTMNDDVNTYTQLGSTGKLFFTIPTLSIVQTTTQASKGGITELYLQNGTYVKSFYSVMYSPSSVKISMMGDTHRRIHHKINWNNTTPCIIDENLKK